MNLWDVGKLVLIVATPTLLGAAIIHAPRWWDSWSCYWDDHRRRPPEPFGPPIEQLAADLRRLLRLHGSMTVSAAAAMRAHRLWAVEAAIAVRAIEAARGPRHRPPGAGTSRRAEPGRADGLAGGVVRGRARAAGRGRTVHVGRSSLNAPPFPPGAAPACGTAVHLPGGRGAFDCARDGAKRRRCAPRRRFSPGPRRRDLTPQWGA